MKRIILIVIAAISVLGLVSIGLAQTVTPPEKPGVQQGAATQPVVNPEASKPLEKPAAKPEKASGEPPLIAWIFAIIVAGFIGLLGLTILYLILWSSPPYKINLSLLISEQDGTASMSRFQLLVFTFVIASGLFIITIHLNDFPKVDGSILQLLGISSGSYLGSKIIQTVKESKGSPDAAPNPQDQGKQGEKVNPEPGQGT
jgi:hypothetical protein